MKKFYDELNSQDKKEFRLGFGVTFIFIGCLISPFIYESFYPKVYDEIIQDTESLYEQLEYLTHGDSEKLQSYFDDLKRIKQKWEDSVDEGKEPTKKQKKKMREIQRKFEDYYEKTVEDILNN